ncbi:MAG: riboflavin synthase subunit alpha [Aliivibrio sp.]|uniref:riboflavin synthase subunit alpha n=1 Tax=Aliivibrio sp. TaxID=1872443 RepID=UPI001A3B672E|nr:riboflavin synthase subunit alpha [Aliivibrio sp.]
MFTGIIQAVANIKSIVDKNGIRTFEIEFPFGFCDRLEIGASVSVDGVCLTVTELLSSTRVKFDVMLQSLNITTLSQYSENAQVNVERAAKDGAEIGGHPLSGHVDFFANVMDISHIEDNYRIRISVSKKWLRYIFPKGYIAVNGASLTISDVDKKEGCFDVWLIPETRRMTVFESKVVGDALNIEIERGTQVVVDTVRATLEENLGELLPMLEALLEKQGVDVSALASTKLGIDNKRK